MGELWTKKMLIEMIAGKLLVIKKWLMWDRGVSLIWEIELEGEEL